MEKEYNEYLWSPKQPRVYEASPLAISGTPMSEEDLAMLSKVENLQQKFQQDPIVKRSKQWEMQQKQREEEIATSKKWLELHPEDEYDSPYTILERGKHQAIIDGKDPSYYEKMINDGEQFTKGALSVLSLPYLGATAAGAYGYGASLGARGLFAGQGIYGLANENGVRKTANLIKSGDYGKAALSGAENALNVAMILPGAKFLRNVAKYGIKSTVAGDMLAQNVRYNAPNMETVADYTNKQTFDNLMKYPDKEYNNIPVYLDHNTMKIKKVKNPELVKFEFWPNKFGEPVQLKKAADEFGNEVFLKSFDRNQGRYVDNTPLNMDQKFIHYRASEGYDGKTLFPKADNKVDPVGHIWFNANSSAHSFPDAYKSEHFAIDPIPSTSHSWSKSFRLVSDPVDVSNAIHTKYNPITLGLETQIKPFTPPKNSAIGKTSYAFFERPSKLSEAERLGIPKHERDWDYQFFKSIKEENPELTSYIRTKHFAEQSTDNKLTSSFFPKGRTLDEDLVAFADDNLWTYYRKDKTDFPIKLTHVSPNNFYVFDYTRQARYPDGHFFFSMHDRPQFGKGTISKDFYIYDKNVKPISEYTGDDMHRINKNTGNYLLRELDSYSANSALIQDAIRDKTFNTIYGYDSGSNFVEGMYEFAVPRNTQMKLVDPITYDNNGHIIKLSKRDNFNNPDFRYKQGGILKRVESGKSGIHIKPENRGKFTALKKRTGKSSTWYKEHGTPAQKKMAVFALNAKKWKH